MRTRQDKTGQLGGNLEIPEASRAPPLTCRGNGNEQVQKARVILTKRTTLHGHQAFFAHFLAVTARLKRETFQCHV